ncbi:hypothetical protein CspHIS471_0702990 [Cutaneotrichosporon sp. HIS471]|nr:hypothetical protein CspHIS471_0702990 [Cutaneotrichosporon sp. HIS471]
MPSVTTTRTSQSEKPHEELNEHHNGHATEDPSDYFDAAADAFLQQHLVSATKLVFRIAYHTATTTLGLRIAKWYFDHTRPLADQRFSYLLLSAVGAIPFVLAVPLYGLLASYLVRRGINFVSRSLPSQQRDITIPLLAAIAVLTFALLWQSATPPPQNTSPNPFVSPFPPARQFDPTVLRYELHADVQATVQMHLADLRRELVAQSQSHAKAMSEVHAQVRQLQDDLETLQNRSVATSLQNAVDACSVAKVAELAAAAFELLAPAARWPWEQQVLTDALDWVVLPQVSVIALLPINVLAAILGAPVRACSRIANHLGTNAAYYRFTMCIIGTEVGVYYLITYLDGVEEDDRQMYDPLRLHKQILAELAELRAQVQALRQTE